MTPLSPEEQIRDRVAAQLSLLRGPLEELTGLSSRWTGVVRLLPTHEEAYATLRSDAAIEVRPDLYRMKIRWRTLLHELIHSLAAPVGDKYQAYIGWEEGPVEALQRALLWQVMAAAGQTYDAELVRESEALWEYNEYVGAVEGLRTAFGSPDTVPFYTDLLQVSVEGRSPYLALKAARAGRRDVAMLVSATSARLRLKIKRIRPAEERERLRWIEGQVDEDE